MLAPLTIADLLEHHRDGRCLVLEGGADKFTSLVTLEDIERQLNNGANASVFAHVIKDGHRTTLVNSNAVWAPSCLKKSEFLEHIKAGNSFMLANSSQVSRGLSRLCDELEACFIEQSIHADVHLYVSMNELGNSYNAHRDRPQHKLLLQAYGQTHWKLYEPKKELPKDLQYVAQDQEAELLNQVAEFDLTQGDLLYMPAGVFHRVTHVGGPRVSISIPFFAMQEATPMDRTHIPFTKLFSQASQSCD